MNDEGKCISTCGLVKKVNEFTFAVWPTNDSEVAFRMIVPKNKDDYYMNELHLNFFDFRIGQLLPYDMAGLFQKLMVFCFSKGLYRGRHDQFLLSEKIIRSSLSLHHKK